MTKWFREELLIGYWEDNCKKYSLPDGTKIMRAERNLPFGRYPDISKNELDTGEIVPCEIEWVTTNFYAHGHNIDLLKDNDGFLVTVVENSAFDVAQIVINHDDFLRWLEKKSKYLGKETLEHITKECKARTDSFVWIIYVSSRAQKNYELAKEIGIWGFGESNSRKRRGQNNIEQIMKNDVVVFINHFSFDEKKITPRIKDVNQYIGIINEIFAVRVKQGYYFDEEIIYKDRLYPHRFQFEITPMFQSKNITFNKELFGELLHRQIAKQISANTLSHIDATMFLRLMKICGDNNESTF